MEEKGGLASLELIKEGIKSDLEWAKSILPQEVPMIPKIEREIIPVIQKIIEKTA